MGSVPIRSALGGAVAMSFVGGSVAVTAALGDSPFWTLQAVRYAVASAALFAFCRWTGRPLHRPRGHDWLWLGGVAGCGLVLFNVALVAGGQHAEPAVLGVAVAGVPVVLAVVGPLIEGAAPHAQAVFAAVVVTAGAALVEGTGHCDALGLLWALVVFACEAGFTLLAMPVLCRHGPYGVSVHSTWLAAVVFAVVGVWREGPTAAMRFTTGEVAATVYLSLAVTAAAFVLWYGCVSALGAARAGLLTGIAPVAAAATDVALGRPMPGPGVITGILIVALGLALGLRGGGTRRTPPPAQHLRLRRQVGASEDSRHSALP